MTMIIATLIVSGVSGCVAVPQFDAAGEPILNEDGAQKVKYEFSGDKAGEATQVASPFLPPPFGQILTLIGGIATLVINRKDDA
jgi:hypothetical protein